MTRYLLPALLLLSGCAQLPPLPGDAEAKRFDAVADRAVIYVVRPPLDRRFVAPIQLNEEMLGSTYPGTFMRLVVPGGRHLISGYVIDIGQIRLDTVAGQIYFVSQTTWGFDSLQGSNFQQVDAATGQSQVRSGALTSEYIR
jgi:hypothetical protein